MSYLEQIQRGIDFIEAHLDTEISLAEVARVAGISQWHFQRIFKALTNETLKTYIRSRRLAGSLDALLATDARIIDIALVAGFQSQESFTRAFKKHFGTTPNEYRKLGENSLFLRKAQFDLAYLKHINEKISQVPDLLDFDEMHLVGLETPFYSVDSEKNNIGETLPALWGAFVPRLGEVANAISGVAYGVIRQHEDGDGLLRYSAAVQVSSAAPIPAGMSKTTVPAATYAVFTHTGPAETIDRTVNYIYSSWLAQSGHRHTYGPDIELYGKGYVPESDTSQIGYAIPVVPKLH